MKKYANASLVGVLALTALGVACNLSGAFDGGPASAGQLIVTLLFVLGWGAFSVIARKTGRFRIFALCISALSLLSAALSLLCVLRPEEPTAVLVLLAVNPLYAPIFFYGLRFFASWAGTYAIAAALSAVWLGYCLYALGKS